MRKGSMHRIRELGNGLPAQTAAHMKMKVGGGAYLDTDVSSPVEAQVKAAEHHCEHAGHFQRCPLRNQKAAFREKKRVYEAYNNMKREVCGCVCGVSVGKTDKMRGREKNRK